MVEGIIINDPENLEEIKKRILVAGKDKFHVLADFDRTLTTGFIEGEKVQSLMVYLRNGDYLTPDYVKKAHELFEIYHPIEIDSNIPYDEKAKKMEEWWRKHFELLIKSGLDKKTLERYVKDVKIEFRKGVSESLDILHKNNIPLVIISSSGLGSVIPMYLKRERRLYDNIYVVANILKFDEHGKVVSVEEPIIHSLNKSEVSLKRLSIYPELEKRRNVLLLGDNLGDLGMIEGFDYESLIKIGFLNEESENSLESYKKSFDVIITNDGNFEYVNKLLREIVK